MADLAVKQACFGENHAYLDGEIINLFCLKISLFHLIIAFCDFKTKRHALDANKAGFASEQANFEANQANFDGAIINLFCPKISLIHLIIEFRDKKACFGYKLG